MTNIAFLYGTIAGTILIAAMLLGIVVMPEHGGASLWFGYLSMLLALSLIFFGIKRYRDTQGGGIIKFVPALMLGIGIAAVAGVIYVMVWEVYLAATNYTFIDVYANKMIAATKAAGAPAAEVDKLIVDMNWAKEIYANPLSRMATTFVEVFPVGLIIALISAALLRNPKVLPARA
jgi:hypothetical protein